jgi:broad specificity phosphatase PhoE
MKHLYYLRHGESVHNALKIIGGNSPLTEKGREQARQAGRLAHEAGLSFDLIACSTLDRAIDTAHIFASEVSYEIDAIRVLKELNERFFGSAEGKNWLEHFAISEKEYFANPLIVDSVDGAEKLAELHTRARRLLQDVSTFPQESVLLVAHAALLRSIQRVLGDLPFDAPLEPSDNATLIKLI